MTENFAPVFFIVMCARILPDHSSDFPGSCFRYWVQPGWTCDRSDQDACLLTY